MRKIVHFKGTLTESKTALKEAHIGTNTYTNIYSLCMFFIVFLCSSYVLTGGVGGWAKDIKWRKIREEKNL